LVIFHPSAFHPSFCHFIQVHPSPPSIKHPRWANDKVGHDISSPFRNLSPLVHLAFHILPRRSFIQVLFIRVSATSYISRGDLSSKFFSSKFRPLHPLPRCPFIQVLFIQG
jgi:hypothetical protein